MRSRKRRRGTTWDDEVSDIPAPRPHLEADQDSLTASLIAEAGADPARLADKLAQVDDRSRARVLTRLNRVRGNAYVQSIVQGIAARQAGLHAQASGGGAGAGVGRGETLTLEREIGDEEQPEIVEEPVVEEEADVPVGATESIGPETSSSYPLAAVSLGDVANQVSGRDEAGKCAWGETWNYKAMGGKINAVTVTVTISVEMPSWTPPPSMLPKAKAEWDRWYAALLAHEQGHVKLIHDHFDGLANKILGKTAAQGKVIFNGAKAALKAASDGYDAKTGHGKKAGTIIDTSIEDKEIDEKKKEDEAKKKKEEAEKGGKKAEVEGEAPAETPT